MLTTTIETEQQQLQKQFKVKVLPTEQQNSDNKDIIDRTNINRQTNSQPTEKPYRQITNTSTSTTTTITTITKTIITITTYNYFITIEFPFSS